MNKGITFDHTHAAHLDHGKDRWTQIPKTEKRIIDPFSNKKLLQISRVEADGSDLQTPAIIQTKFAFLFCSKLLGDCSSVFREQGTSDVQTKRNENLAFNIAETDLKPDFVTKKSIAYSHIFFVFPRMKNSSL